MNELDLAIIQGRIKIAFTLNDAAVLRDAADQLLAEVRRLRRQIDATTGNETAT